MPEGRMLKKVISTSRKINSLSLKAALLFTWCIASEDSEGFLEAEPDWIKYNIVPRRKDISEEEIPELIVEIIQSGAWLPFLTETGRRVVQDCKFRDHQKIRREADSKFLNKIKPIPKENIEKVWLSPGVVRDQSGTSPGVVHPNISELKGSELKERPTQNAPAPARVATPVPKEREKQITSSKKEIDEETVKDLEEVCKKIDQVKYLNSRFNCYAFLQQKINMGTHPKAILHAFYRLLEDPESRHSPWAYCDSIVATESGNYYEKDHLTEYEAIKKEESEGMDTLGNILKGIQKRAGK